MDEARRSIINRALTEPAIRRIARKANIQNVSAESYDAIRMIFEDELRHVVKDSVAIAGSHTNTITSSIVRTALEMNGHPIFGRVE